MKNQWPIWVFLVGVIIVVLIAFNYQSGHDSVPVDQLFPEDAAKQEPAVEYEFVDAVNPEPMPSPEGITTPAYAPSSVTPTTQATVPSQPITSNLSAVRFTIQVLSSNNKDRAEEALKKAQAAGYPATLGTIDLKEKGIWNRLYIGQFQTKAEADEYLKKVKKDYPDGFILTPNK
jgi:cell division septation protein DedD